MRVLLIDELYEFPQTDLKNIYEVSEQLVKDGLLSQEDKNILIGKMQQLNIVHHNKNSFEYDFMHLFSVEAQNKENFISQTIDRINMGAHFGGLELITGIHLFSETVEMGITVMVNPKEINKDNIEELILGIDWFIEGIANPLNAHSEMNFIKLQKDLDIKTSSNNRMKV